MSRIMNDAARERRVREEERRRERAAHDRELADMRRDMVEQMREFHGALKEIQSREIAAKKEAADEKVRAEARAERIEAEAREREAAPCPALWGLGRCCAWPG